MKYKKKTVTNRYLPILTDNRLREDSECEISERGRGHRLDSPKMPFPLKYKALLRLDIKS